MPRTVGRALGRLAALAACALAVAAVVAGCSVADAEAGGGEGVRATVRTVRVGDDRIAWYERGQGPPLVMAIGTGSTMAEWDPALLRLLGDGRRLILFDYPGVGRSSPLRARRITFEGLADTTARFMEAIGVARADVLGWSMGGFVAQGLAVRHPERVYPLTPEGQAEGRAFLARLDEARERGEIPDDLEVDAATVRAQVAAEDPWLRSNANWRALAGLRAPTLAAGGTLDRVVPAVNLERIAARIPGARLELFPGAAHGFLFQDRERFARSVHAFLG